MQRQGPDAPPLWQSGGGRPGKSKPFFFEKKKQKTFNSLVLPKIRHH
jgi:hypothetical protein